MECRCDACKVYECAKPNVDLNRVPENCPMRDKAFNEAVATEYSDPEVQHMYVAAKTAGDGLRCNRFVPRLRRLIDLCKNMNYHKIGLSYCIHFRKEAEQYVSILRRHGLIVSSACCTNGCLDQKQFSFPGDGSCEQRNACNPIGLAQLMNKEDVQFNFLMGLCTGQDSLFYKYANAMTTSIAANDPATGHCPTKVLYLYNSYYDMFFQPDDKEAYSGEMLPSPLSPADEEKEKEV